VSAIEEEPYSTMFGSLKHPIRRKILRMLAEKPRSFSEMLESSGVSSSHLTYHLENLGQLVSKRDDGKYRLSTFGEATVTTMNRIEETPTKPEHLSSPLKWKSLSVALLIGVVILAGITYTQYQSLNKISVEYGKLSAQVNTPTSPNMVMSNWTILQNGTSISLNPMPMGNMTTLSNSTFPNGTTIQTGLTETLSGGMLYSNGTALAYGPLVIPCHVEELANGALVIVPDLDLQSLIANSSRIITDP